jgi:hypothetical protein
VEEANPIEVITPLRRVVLGRPATLVDQLRLVLEMIKIEHTLFALPFAFMGMLLAAKGWPPWRTVGWIVVAMVGARSAAMRRTRGRRAGRCRRGW